MSNITRRSFTQSAIATTAALSTALSASRVIGANDRVRVGFIGLGNRGDQVLDAFLQHKDCEIAAICETHFVGIIPHFTGRLERPHESHEWAKKMRDEIFTGAFGALGAEVAAFKADHAER